MNTLLLTMLLMVGGCVTFMVLEIADGIKQSKRLISAASWSNMVIVPFRIVFCFWRFFADVFVTAFFIKFFILGGVTGSVAALFASNIISCIIWWKGKKARRVEEIYQRTYN